MQEKTEGAVIPPLPLFTRPRGEAVRPLPRLGPRPGEPGCEVCGAAVIATHCKRICLKCGFMTGCSEGI